MLLFRGRYLHGTTSQGRSTRRDFIGSAWCRPARARPPPPASLCHVGQNRKFVSPHCQNCLPQGSRTGRCATHRAPARTSNALPLPARTASPATHLPRSRTGPRSPIGRNTECKRSLLQRWQEIGPRQWQSASAQGTEQASCRRSWRCLPKGAPHTRHENGIKMGPPAKIVTRTYNVIKK